MQVNKTQKTKQNKNKKTKPNKQTTTNQTKTPKPLPQKAAEKMWSFQPSNLSQTAQLRGAELPAEYFSLHVSSI